MAWGRVSAVIRAITLIPILIKFITADALDLFLDPDTASADALDNTRDKPT